MAFLGRLPLSVFRSYWLYTAKANFSYDQLPNLQDTQIGELKSITVKQLSDPVELSFF